MNVEYRCMQLWQQFENNTEQALSIATVPKQQEKSFCQHFSNASFQAVN